MSQVVLGPFALEKRVGKGGMGDVWRGRHLTQGTPVAVKVITPRWAREPQYIDALWREVEASARLTHGGIVSVLDFGEIPFAAASATFGDFREGSPYFVMEYVDGSPLNYRQRPWAQTREILARLLDALAHAHARGVIHRDIKPANILIDGTGRPKITDFGLAHVLDDHASGDALSASGTPRYMAPEQIMGSPREQGPWTDLYALGCLAYGLMTGGAPFGGRVEDILRGHLHDPVPSVGESAPDGFEEWLSGMLAKQPLSRFRRAADALWALLQLDDWGDSLPSLTFATDALPTLISLTRPTLAGGEERGSTTEVRRPAFDRTPAGDATAAFRPAPPPMPASWGIEDVAVMPELIGAGLGIFGLRTIPLVGRRAERDVVWELLSEVHSGGSPRLLLLRGDAGTGKSRLAEWIGGRAHELGVATLLRAVHSPVRGAHDGLGPMIASALRLHGLGPVETYERIRDFWFSSGADAADLYTCEALSHIVLGDDAAEGIPRVKFSSAKQRWSAVTGFLARTARERPVFLWLDDIQWGADALGLCRYILDHPEEAQGVFVVMTARDEALLHRPIEASRLDSIRSDEACTTIKIRPLLEAHRMRLIRLLLGLESDVAKQVAQRTGGNPLFAVQLVGDWIERGALELKPTGFGLREGAELEVPDDIHVLWQRRLQYVLDALPDQIRADAANALELAAALGQDVDGNEWLAVSGEEESVPRKLVGILVSHRLAIRTQRGWAFAHGMLRESLERHARDQGRWRTHQRRCAEVLDDRLHAREKWPRVAQHYLSAEMWTEALEPLRRTAVLGFDLGDYEEGNASLDSMEHAATRAKLSADDGWWARIWTLRARLKRETVELDSAAEYLERALPIARRLGPTEVLAEVLGTQASLATLTGDLATAKTLLDECLAIWQQIDNPVGEAHAQRTLNWVLFWSGDYEGAREALAAAKKAYEAAGDKDGLGWVHYEEASIALHTEQPDRAAELTEVASRLFEQVGSLVALADCCNMRGEIARTCGQLEAAEGWYRDALAYYRPAGHTNELIARENLGLTLLAAGDAEGALSALQKVLDENVRLGRAPYVLRVSSELIECAGVLGDASAHARYYELFDATRAKTRFADLDTATALERAGDAWEHRNAAHAARCWRDAEIVWGQLQREDRCELVRAKLRDLTESRR